MPLDLYGCPLSTENPEIVQIVDQFSLEFLRFGKRMDSILPNAERHPNEAILQIYAAIFCLCGQSEASYRQASHYLDNAARTINLANAREKGLFSVAWHWLNHLLAEALKDIERQCFKWPKDLTSLRIAEFLFYCKGQKYESKRFLRLTTQCLSELRDNPYFLSIHSFALELNGKYEESLQFAEKALLLNPENPWAHHTLAHLYLNTGLIDEGIERLESHAPSWKQFHRVVESHNLWHLALLYIENLNFEQARAIYQRAEWTNRTLLAAEEIDAAALLWRLSFAGEDDAKLWLQLSESIGIHGNFAIIPFTSALLCFALKKGGRSEALQAALEYITKLAHEQVKEDRYVWREIGLPLIYGSLAFAENDYRQAVRFLEPIIEHAGCVGGSDAQIDLFYQTFLKSLVGVGRYSDAESLLHHITQGSDLTKLERKWLSECQGTDVLLLQRVI